MQALDVVIFSNDKHLISALCEEVRLMGYSCGIATEGVQLNGIVVYDLASKKVSLPTGNGIIYIADKKEEELASLPKGAHVFTRPFSLEEFACTLRKLI